MSRRGKITLPPYEQALALAGEMPREDQERLLNYLKFQLQQKPKKKKPEQGELV